VLGAAKQKRTLSLMKLELLQALSAKKALNDLLAQEESKYINAATSDNTRRAYQGDIEHFLKQGGVLPADADSVERYLKNCAPFYNPRTLVRRVTALRQWHTLKQVDDPTKSPRVTKTLRGILRLHGKPRKQAPALRLNELDRMMLYSNENPSLINIRNRAVLLLGFFGAFRRSELVALTWEQVQFVSDGMTVTLWRSKTDQVGEGQRCIIPFGDDLRCPVRALIAWREAAKLFEGPIFRRISKTGQIGESALSDRYVNQIVQQSAKNIGLPQADHMSSHSLRRGFATESARLGASLPDIQRHGRWRCTKTVLEYIEAGREFSDSAVNVLFDFKRRG
jgi:integrase